MNRDEVKSLLIDQCTKLKLHPECIDNIHAHLVWDIETPTKDKDILIINSPDVLCHDCAVTLTNDVDYLETMLDALIIKREQD